MLELYKTKQRVVNFDSDSEEEPLPEEKPVVRQVPSLPPVEPAPAKPVMLPITELLSASYAPYQRGARPSEVEPEEEVVARPSLFADPQYTDYQRMNAGDESDDDLPAEPVRPSQSFEPAESAAPAAPAAPATPAAPARPAEPAEPAEPVETASAATEEKQEEENVLRCGGEKAA